MKARVLSHEERLEMTKRNTKLLFEQIKNGKDLPPATPGIENLPKFNPDVCEHCGSTNLFHEAGCVRCIDCGMCRCG